MNVSFFESQPHPVGYIPFLSPCCSDTHHSRALVVLPHVATCENVEIFHATRIWCHPHHPRPRKWTQHTFFLAPIALPSGGHLLECGQKRCNQSDVTRTQLEHGENVTQPVTLSVSVINSWWLCGLNTQFLMKSFHKTSCWTLFMSTSRCRYV